MKLMMKLCSAIIVITSGLLVGCGQCGNASVPCLNPGTGGSSSAASTSGSGSTSGGPFSISGVVTGLASNSTGVVLQDNATDNLTVTSNGTFTFKTQVAKGQPFAVFVTTPPTSPVQTCTVVNGSGIATAAVTNIQVTCSSGTASIGGTVVGLSGVGLVLQDNATDNLSVAVSSPFTFKTALPIGSAYKVTVATQPTSPTQTCTVTNGSGTANANVGNIQITCSTGTISIGGTVSGLAQGGSGITLQDSGGDNLTLHANGTFTFPTLVPSGFNYNATILAQPSGPNQTCNVVNGSGTATSNITNVQVVCPAVFHTIGGTVVGLVGANSGMVLQNNFGDNLTISGNGTFTFNTPIADGSTYDVSVLVFPTTQPGIGVTTWFYQGIATAAVTTIVVDGGHNDWAWFDGANANNQYGSPITPPTPPITSFDSSTPGSRKYPATWTDYNGNLWLFGGDGLEVSGTPVTYLNDMWEYIGTQNYNGSYANYWNNLIAEGSLTGPVPRQGAVTWTQPGAGGDLFLFGGESGGFLNDIWRYNIANNAWTYVSGGFNQAGVYGVKGTPANGNIPGARWGATTRIDASGTVWLFGGYGYDSAGNLGLLNDLWNYNITLNQWTWVAGSKTVNPTGSYGALGTPNGQNNFPGGRQAAMSWIDKSGNFWLFGGFDLDSGGNPDALNDLWEFKAGQWTWMSGANVVNQKGVYGTVGVAAAANVPGARWSAASWTDLSGNLWLFGGQGYDAAANGSLSDLWEYKGGQWIWTKGPSSVDQSGIYGQYPPSYVIFPYVGNGPGSRFAPAYWTATLPTGTPGGAVAFWMFGGEGFDAGSGNGNGLLNDLWRYLPYP